MKRGLLHRRRFVRLVSACLIGVMVLWSAAPVGLALPSGEQVAHGQASFTREAGQLIVDQTSSRAIINYSAFDIDQGESVRFVQPGASAAALNRVTGGGASTIAGLLQANGNIYLVNPSGIIFTPSAQVDVHGLVASAMQISDGDFLSGAMRFTGAGGSVVNQGVINAAYVALLAGSVRNEGTVNAGSIQVLAGAQSVRLAEVQGGSIELIVEDAAAETVETGPDSESEDEAPVDPLIPDPALGDLINMGTLDASGYAGGQIDLAGRRVAHFGTATADGLVGDGGTIRMQAEDMLVLGSESVTTANAGEDGDGGTILLVAENAMAVGSGARIEARGGAEAGDGGFVETSGRQNFHIGSAPDVSAQAGSGGLWYIDPHSITIADNDNGHFQIDDSGDPWTPQEDGAVVDVNLLVAALNSGNVHIQTQTVGEDLEAGDITVAAGISTLPSGYSWNSEGTLTLEAHNDIIVDFLIRNDGTGGLNLWADSDGSGQGNVQINADITMVGGDVHARGQTIVQSAGTMTANRLAMEAVGNIGGPGAAAISTDVNVLAALSSAGSIYISEENALTVGAFGGLSGVEAAQNIKIEAGSLIVNEAVTATLGDALLHTLADNVTINAAVTAGDDITVLAFLGVTQTAGGDLQAGGTLDVEAQGASIGMADGATGTAAGNARYLASQNVTLGGVAGANVRIEATGGSIFDGGDTDKDVTAAEAQLVAGDSVGALVGAGRIDTAGGTLAASAAAGGIYVSDADGLTVGEVAAIPVNRVQMDSTSPAQAGAALSGAVAAQNVYLDSGADAPGSLTVDRAVTGSGGSVVIGANDGNVQVNAAVDGGGYVSLSGNNITTSEDGGIVSGGSAWLTADESATVGGGIRTVGGYVGVSGSDVHIDSLIETGGGGVSLWAENDLLVSGGVDARGEPLKADSGGTIDMVGMGTVRVVSAPVQTDFDGDIFIRSTDPSGTVEVDTPVHAEAGVIEIVAGGDAAIGPNADVQTVSGDILLHGGLRGHDDEFAVTTSIGEGDLLLDGAVSSQSGQILGVGHRIEQSGGGLSSASGNVGLLAADTLEQTAGSIGGANVLLESDGPMRLDGSVTAADSLLVAVNAGPLSGGGALSAPRIGIKANGNVTGIGVNAGDELLVQMLSGSFQANNIGVPQSVGSNAGIMTHNLRGVRGGNETQGDLIVPGPNIEIVGQPIRFVPGDIPTDPGDPIRVVETGPGPTGLSLAERLAILARFSEETPNMKERARLFDEFVFLHLTMQISEFSMELDLNFVDYLLFGEARIAANAELPASAKDVIYIGGIRPYRVTTSTGPSYQGVIR